MPGTDTRRLAAWFAGPKAENGEWFAETIRRIVQDYHSWRRNYFPEDGVVVDSALKRQNEAFHDDFDDRLLELLARLKADFPFQSPRYAAHMLAEQTLPSIAGYFAAMLYNPNNVSYEAAPVTVRLEIEAAQMIARMLGYPDAWAHLTGGGTVANIEALWVARTVRYLPLVVRDMRRTLGLPEATGMGSVAEMMRLSPDRAMRAFADVFTDASRTLGAGEATTRRVVGAYVSSRFNVVERGLEPVLAEVGSRPVILIPESHHYCFEKAMDVLGLGRGAIVPVRVDADFRMIPGELEARLDELASKSLHTLAVVAVVGSTEEGAVDPVDRIVALRAKREQAGLGSFWLHADAAYGGYLRTMTLPTRLGLGEPFTESLVAGKPVRLELQFPQHATCQALECLGECDSITIDPHKLGYIPYPAGAVCFKNNVVKPITRQEAPYLSEGVGDVESERRADAIGMYILEGSKPGAAAAAVWLSHTLIPLDSTGHGVLMQETVRNACELHALLEQYPELAGHGGVARAMCLCVPGSNIVCYAFVPRVGASLREINAFNRAIYERFTITGSERVYDQQFFISRTSLRHSQYCEATVKSFLARLGVSPAEYREEGVFLLRSVLMNPWYAQAKCRGRYFLSELVEELYRVAESCAAGSGGVAR